MILHVKDFASFIPPECQGWFEDKDGDDCVSLAVVDRKSFDDANRRLRFTASDDSVDLHDEVIDAGAFHELRGVYLRNPVILAGHQHRLSTGLSPAMAHAVELRTEKNPLVGVAQFGEGEHINAVSRDLWEAYRGGNQRAFSVGFRSRDMEKRDGRWVHTKALLLEISGVPVPANSNALVLNYIYGRIALTGQADTAADAGETRHRLTELAAQMGSLQKALGIEAGSGTGNGDGEDDPNADPQEERDITECLASSSSRLRT